MSVVGRDALVTYLDQYLAVADWRDKAHNGLQVEGRDQVAMIALATDAALATFVAAAEAGADFLIVHHGLFWGEPLPIVGTMRARIAALLDSGVSLYGAHLPLDAHLEVGNNVVLARLLDLQDVEPFGMWDGRAIGVRGRFAEPVEPPELGARLEALLGAPPDVLAFGRGSIERVAIVSGDASELIPDAAAAGLDAFVTGETRHQAWHVAREHGLHVIFAGHYVTETLGVRALGDHLSERFGVETVFLDAPTGY
jgi:dinuclear metal center YbgI/SA1388 family protein